MMIQSKINNHLSLIIWLGVLYNCRETFTDVMSALQIRLFMQNKAKFRKSQMIINKVLTKDYEKRTLGEHGKNEPKTNPNEPNSQKAKMNVTSILTKDYENKSNWAICENEPNSNPKQSQSKPISEAKNAAAYGMEVFRQLKQNEKTRQVPVFMLTSKGTGGDIDQAISAGIDDYIVKPFSTSEIDKTIRNKLKKTRDAGADKKKSSLAGFFSKNS